MFNRSTHVNKSSLFLVFAFFICFLLLSFVVFSTFGQLKEDVKDVKSDECADHEFNCNKNETNLQPFCILSEQVCDGKKDCSNGEDESESVCEDINEFKDFFERTVNSTPSIDSKNDNQTTLNNTSPMQNKAEYRTKITSCIDNDCDFQHINAVCCDNLNLTTSKIEEFLPFKSTIKLLRLDNNNLSHLDSKMFKNLSNLLLISIQKNNLTYLDNNVFIDVYRLKRIFLNQNQLKTLPNELFNNLLSLQFVEINRNQLSFINLTMFAPLQNLSTLDLSYNELTLKDQVFSYHKRLSFLNLRNNHIEQITESTFKMLPNLINLDLKANRIHQISPLSFERNIFIRTLDLSFNQISDSQISSQLFNPLKDLRTLKISQNQFNYLPQDIFKNNLEITSLSIEGSTINNISIEHFENLKKLEFIYFPHFRYCLYVPRVKVCKPSTDQVSSLRSLLALPHLKIMVWAFSILIIVLNFSVLFMRSLKNPKHAMLATLVKFLSFSDSLIGFYMLVISYYDYQFGNEYHKSALNFVNSIQCTYLAVLAVFSKQFSLFIVLLISFDRNRQITIQNFHFSTIYYYILVAIGFLISLFIALFPVLFWSQSNNVYFSANMLCYPLHLSEPFLLGWQFNAIVNICFNLPIVSTIIFLYTHIYITVKRTRKEVRQGGNFEGGNITTNSTNDLYTNPSKHLNKWKLMKFKKVTAQPPSGTNLIIKNKKKSITSEEKTLAIRLFFIVATDCICWLPIIFIKILALFDIKIPALLNAWLIIVILPFNSLWNPILYTFAAKKRLSIVFKKGFYVVKNKLMSLFKGKKAINDIALDCRVRKTSESCDLRTSTAFNQNILNSSESTVQYTDHKSINEQENCPNYNYVSMDYNNNQNFL